MEYQRRKVVVGLLLVVGSVVELVVVRYDMFILATSRFGETGVQCSMTIVNQLIDN